MARWKGSTRKQRLPSNWRAIRKRILERDGFRCQHVLGAGRRCGEPANQVDHIIPSGSDDDSNLQSLCETHHLWKTGQDSWKLRRKRLAEAKARAERKYGHTEEHSGTGEPFRHPWQT